MKPLFIAEWAIAMGIISWREFRAGRPPIPGTLLVVSGLFAALAVIADTGPGADRLAAMVGAGLDIAAFMDLFTNPPGSPARTAAKPKAATGTTQAPGTSTAGGRG